MSRRPEPKITKHEYKGFKILGSYYSDPPKYGKKRTYLILKDDEYIVSPEVIIPKLKDAKEKVDELVKSVYLVGYECDIETETISFWDWYHTPEDAKNRLINLKRESKEDKENWKGIIYNGTIHVPKSIEGNEEITEFVQRFLDENDYENSFK